MKYDRVMVYNVLSVLEEYNNVINGFSSLELDNLIDLIGSKLTVEIPVIINDNEGEIHIKFHPHEFLDDNYKVFQSLQLYINSFQMLNFKFALLEGVENIISSDSFFEQQCYFCDNQRYE